MLLVAALLPYLTVALAKSGRSGYDNARPREWSDRVDDWFSDAQVRPLDGVGHFTPLEAPEAFAAAVLERAGV